MLQTKQFKALNSKTNQAAILNQFENALEQMERGKQIIITIQVEEESLVKMKRRYFQMVTELGRFAGYRSTEDREQFKTDVKQALKVKSIEAVDSKELMADILESLHQFASENYDFRFNPNESKGIISFDPGEDNNKP